MLGLVWLSIALASGMATLVSPSFAAALTGAILLGIAGVALALDRAARRAAGARSKSSPEEAKSTQVLISRATSIAERLAPDSPAAAMVVALLAGVASVSLPEKISPLINKLLDDFETSPGARPNA